MSGFQNASIFGSLLMGAVGFAAYAIASWYLELSTFNVFVVTTIAALVFGALFNVVAQYRGTKKIHWLDFALSFLPWDF